MRTAKPQANVLRLDDGDGEAARRREQVLFELAKRNKADVAETFRAITEATAVALDVERTSIWRLLPDGTAIVCEDNFVRAQGRHTAGDILWARDYPSYFSAVAENRVIAAHEVRTDGRTRELRAYLEASGITSMMDVPIWLEGRLYGVICHEHVGPSRHWTNDDETFAANLADLASLALEAREWRTAERRWDAVVNTIQEAVFVLDGEGTIVQANPLAARMIERAGGGVTLTERMELIEFRDEQGRVISADRTGGRRSLSGEIVRGEINHLLFKRTGERRSYRITTAPMRDGDRIHSIVVVMADVTEEVAFDRLKREVLAALAHEFKTPIAIVKGYAQHMSNRPDTSPAERPMVAAIERASNRLQRLIDDLLEVSGISLGRLVLYREPVELTAIVNSVARWAAPMATHHRLVVNAPEGLVVSADRPRLEQAVRRLVDNAIRYSPPGSDVEIGVAPSDHDVVISVRDRGIGIPADQQNRVFELFFRAHAGTPYDVGGLGIGLFMAREITVGHGGAMWFESEEGKGSTFYMRLPRAEVP